MTRRPRHITRPTRAQVHAAMQAQRPLDQPEKPLERKKPKRREWDEDPELEPVED